MRFFARTVRNSLFTMNRSMGTTTTSDLIFEKTGKLMTVQLNRPKALNALSLEMCQVMKEHLLEWKQPSSEIDCFVMKGVGKAFCAGGDVKSIWQDVSNTPEEARGTGKTGHLHSDFFRVEYQMNFLLGSSKIPQISIWDGIVMGGGVGISVLGKYRIATDKTVFAMPETTIGLFPDVGSSSWLPHIPRGIAEYVGLTGCRLSANDLLYAGIATHYCPSDRVSELEETIRNWANSNPSSPSPTSTSLDSLLLSICPSSCIPPQSSVLQDRATAIEYVFKGVYCYEQVKARLESILDPDPSRRPIPATPEDLAWAERTLKTVSSLSPLSIALTCAQYREARALKEKGLGLKECLEMEYRMVNGCMRHPDFREGVRALLVDKDNAPKWAPRPNPEDKMSSFFQPLEYELNLEK